MSEALPALGAAIPQSRAETGVRAADGRFLPGISGNPAGRPRGQALVARIRDETRDGVEIVDFVLSLFRDPTEVPKLRLEAATWLADRGFGRAQVVTRDGEAPLQIVIASAFAAAAETREELSQ